MAQYQFNPFTNNLDLVGTSGSGPTVVETLTGNSGGAVSPTGNNISTVGTGSITVVGSPGTSTLTTQLTGLTANNVLIGAGTATITKVAPSATSGVPLISQGAAADPAFGTAVVAGGGTGATSFTAYSVITGGTTSTGALQNVSGVGTAGQVLTSNGAAALPSWQSAGGGITPYFAAYCTSTASATAFNPLIYDAIISNVGSAYNNATGIFTAPSSGLYYFTVCISLTGITVADTDMRIILNTTAGLYGLLAASPIANYNAPQNNLTMTFSSTVPMATNDTAFVWALFGSSVNLNGGGQWFQFSGFKIGA